MYLFSEIVNPPYYLSRNRAYFVGEVNVENVKFSIFLDDITLLVYNNMCVVAFLRLTIDLFMESAQR